MHRHKVITAADRKMRLPWWGVLCVMFGTVFLALLFVFFGRFDLARPSLLSAAMVTLAIVMRWKLRRHVWFWITMIIFAALHVPLVLFVPWTTKWVPAILIALLIDGDADWCVAHDDRLHHRERRNVRRVQIWSIAGL